MGASAHHGQRHRVVTNGEYHGLALAGVGVVANRASTATPSAVPASSPRVARSPAAR